MSKPRTVAAIVLATILAVMLIAQIITQRHEHQASASNAKVFELSFARMKQMVDNSDYLKVEIENLDDRLQSLRNGHPGEPMDTWGEADEESFRTDAAESARLKARYNQLALTYDAEMARTGGRFTHPGDIPNGECCVLPPSIRPFQDLQRPDAAAR